MEIVQSVLGKLGFDWQVALANMLNFLIIYFLLKKFVFDKLADAISERKIKAEANVTLRDSLDAEKTSLDELRAEKEKALMKERDAVLVEAEKEKQVILTEAMKDARAIQNKALADGEKEKQKIMESVSSDIKDLSVSLAQKILSSYQEKPDAEKLKALLK